MHGLMIWIRRGSIGLGISILGVVSLVAAQESKLEYSQTVFTEDFEQGIGRWELIDPKSWAVEDYGLGRSLAIIQRESEYAPKVRSPLHIALVKDLELADFELTLKVKSTKDTGAHRDCCLFFNYQDATHFYYVHFGAKPDPASGQIFIVNDAPRTPLTTNVNGFAWDDQWHEIRLRRDTKAGTIEVYFDDMEVPRLVATDTTFGKGRLGIGSFDDMDAFDSIEVKVVKRGPQ